MENAKFWIAELDTDPNWVLIWFSVICFKPVCRDVNLKTIDHVMAGVESVIGRMSKYSMLEKFRSFDKKYIKRFLSKEDAGRLVLEVAILK